MEKRSVFMPVSRELLADAMNLRGLLGPAPHRTPEEQAAARAEYVARQAARLAEAQARHAAVRRRAQLHSAVTVAVLDLHGPADGSLWPECHGCEFGGYDAEPPEWPCQTWTLIADEGLE